jgi:organic radical activating enzyme
MNHNEYVNKVQTELNEVSPSFCVAKWKQVTMHLQTGHTHSCHHPSTHLVPIEEIKRNPSALHNTEFKKHQRKLMLEGTRPTECDYCWRIEDVGKTSDRVYKSSDKSWAYEYINEIAHTPWDANVDPSYVEVSFGSVCNFKCSYCSPSISTQWMEEIERYGPYPTSTKFNTLEWSKKPIPVREENPYVDAFWQWWPTMYTELRQFRITGGEPLLNKNTFKVLDYIIENPNPNLVFSVNTNLNPPKDLLDKFIEKLIIIQNNNCVKRLHIFTSAEAQGKQAEYIRHGMNYNEWLTNMELIIEQVPRVSMVIMSTYNILSLLTFKDFLNDMLTIRRKYRDKAIDNQRTPVIIDIPYLRWPDHQAVYIMTRELLPYIEEQIKFMEDNIEMGHIDHTQSFNGFHDHEIDKLRRIQQVVLSQLDIDDPNIIVNRKDFVKFVDEHDKRRGTNFIQTFPELESFYKMWKTNE